jgi:beta-lactamase class C
MVASMARISSKVLIHAQRIVEARHTLLGAPGVIVVSAAGGRPAERVFVGTDAAGEPLGEDTLFGISSISKLALALAILRLTERGALSLDDPLETHLAGAAAAQPGVTVRRLLCHTSGLPLDLSAELDLYTAQLDGAALRREHLRAPLQTRPGERVQYSDIGYGLLAQVIERLTGRGIAAALRSLVLDPLGVEAYLGEPLPRRRALIADVRGRYAGTAVERYNSEFFVRLGMPWSGMFTTPDGLLGLLRAFMGVPAGFLDRETLAEATRDHTGGLGGGFCTTDPFLGMGDHLTTPLAWNRCPWGLGVELRGDKTPHWSVTRGAPDSFGHIGSSGCLVWADRAADVVWAILGARTTDSGWLLRHAPALGAAVLAQASATAGGTGAHFAEL